MLLFPHGRYLLATVTAAYPDGPSNPREITHAWLTRPFRDYLFLQRFLLGKPDPHRPGPVRTIASDVTRELLAGDEPFVIATGHFAREAMWHLYREGAVPRRILAVVAAVPDSVTTPAEARATVQFGQMLRVIERLRSDTVMETRGSATSARDLLTKSKEPGWAPIVAVDAPLPESAPATLIRPFASTIERGFASGTAQVARVAQVPLLVVVPYVDVDGSIVIEWSDPIPPPDRRDRAGEVELTTQIIDQIELAVGRRPDQYVLEPGWGRRWDPSEERWVDAR